MKDFFISYNGADRAWAEWIGWLLEEAGYSVVLQAWDFRPGGNFVLEMHNAASSTRKTIILLSEAYLRAEYTKPEWAAAFSEDPRGEDRKLIPLRIASCSPDGLLKALIYADLMGLSADEAKSVVLTAVSDAARSKPARAPAFPASGAAASAPSQAAYPGKEFSGAGALSLWQEKLQYLEKYEAIAADPAQESALRKQVEEARNKLRELANPSEPEGQILLSQKPRTADKKLFEELKAALPSSGSIAFIDEFNMAGWSFERDNLRQLDAFYYQWNDPEHEFLDPELDELRQNLHSLVAEYLHLLAHVTFPTRTEGYASVPDDWEETQPERFHEAVDGLHSLAGRVVEAHRRLFRMARRKLEE